VASDRKIAANRKNAKNSTGPKSRAGKRRSRANAFRHGLAIDIGVDSGVAEQIERLTLAMTSPGPLMQTPLLRQLAEVEVDLQRIRKIRAGIFRSALQQTDARLPYCGDLNSQLEKLERYERRAMSRRKRVLRAISQCGGGRFAFWQNEPKKEQ
jgi:hypothetical protein